MRKLIEVREENGKTVRVYTEIDGDQTPPERKTYEVTAESGLFKAGKQYSKGELIELDVQAAANFISLNDIKEVSNEAQ